MKQININHAARIALIYTIASALWVLLSNQLLGLLASNPLKITQLQDIKGWGFVAVTAILLYLERRHTDEKIGFLANIVNYSDDAILSIDRQGNMTSWNLGAEAIFGYSADAMINKPFSVLVPAQYQEERARNFELVLKGEQVDHYETELIGKDGQLIQVSISVSPINDSRGQITGASVIARNVTARKQMSDRLMEQQTALRQYAKRILNTQEEERKRISRELHDQTVQDLVAISQRIDLLQTAMINDREDVDAQINHLETLAHEAIDDVRRLSSDLRPVILDDLGLVVALKALCDELSEQVPTIKVNYNVVGDEKKLPAEFELTIYRLIQEALTNVRKHASEASHATANLYYEDWGMLISVEDDGIGFSAPDVDELAKQGHLGLAGMRERIHLYDGEMRIDSSSGNGTTILFRLPHSQP